MTYIKLLEISLKLYFTINSINIFSNYLFLEILNKN